MFCFEIGHGKWPVHFRIDSRYRESNTGQHVVCSNPVHMVLVHLCPYDDVLIIIIIAATLPGRSPLLDSFCVTGSFFVGVSFVREGVRVVGPRRSTGETQGSPADAPRG